MFYVYRKQNGEFQYLVEDDNTEMSYWDFRFSRATMFTTRDCAAVYAKHEGGMVREYVTELRPDPIVRGSGDFVVVLNRGEKYPPIHYHHNDASAMLHVANALCEIHSCGSMQTDANIIEVDASKYYRKGPRHG